ncbi:hypothetical protein [Erwinia phage FBB1]|nr:hypothetical protein [Erwinia phage FBB1]
MLREKLLKAIELDEVNEIKEFSLKEIEDFINQDHAVSMIPDHCYDSILVSDLFEPEVGMHLCGYIFFSRKYPLASGKYIHTSKIRHIAVPIDGLKLVSTMNTTYLVI